MFWIGLVAIGAANTAQTQLAVNVVAAALDSHQHPHGPSVGHIMPDGTFMAGAMHDAPVTSTSARATDSNSDPDGAGHTHKGHADCRVCGPVAEMASLAISLFHFIKQPVPFAASAPLFSKEPFVAARTATPYAPRAPPRAAMSSAA